MLKADILKKTQRIIVNSTIDPSKVVAQPFSTVSPTLWVTKIQTQKSKKQNKNATGVTEPSNNGYFLMGTFSLISP